MCEGVIVKNADFVKINNIKIIRWVTLIKKNIF